MGKPGQGTEGGKEGAGLLAWRSPRIIKTKGVECEQGVECERVCAEDGKKWATAEVPTRRAMGGGGGSAA